MIPSKHSYCLPSNGHMPVSCCRLFSCISFLFFCCDKFPLWSPVWLRTLNVSQASLKCTIPLPQYSSTPSARIIGMCHHIWFFLAFNPHKHPKSLFFHFPCGKVRLRCRELGPLPSPYGSVCQCLDCCLNITPSARENTSKALQNHVRPVRTHSCSKVFHCHLSHDPCSLWTAPLQKPGSLKPSSLPYGDCLLSPLPSPQHCQVICQPLRVELVGIFCT